MAYILGFTTADGCVNFNPTKWVYSLSYGLNKDDIEILEFIRSEICPTKPISQPNKQDMVRLEFNSKTLCNDLINLGVTPRKTGFEILPKVPDEYRFDYLRGLFDGDGSIYFNEKSKSKWSRTAVFAITCSNKNYLEDLRLKICPLGKIRVGNNTFDWRIQKQSDIRSIASLMYVNSNFSLKRKRDKMLLV